MFLRIDREVYLWLNSSPRGYPLAVNFTQQSSGLEVVKKRGLLA